MSHEKNYLSILDQNTFNMIANCVILLAMNLLVICAAFSKSPLMQFQVKSFDAVASMKQAAVLLNVPVPGKTVLHYRFDCCVVQIKHSISHLL
jgi:hypothetical protein